MSEREFKRGDQIAYIPYHADGNIEHPDVEHGFITSVVPEHGVAFCRYWSSFFPGLRTTANSEAIPIACLVHASHWRSQIEVDELLEGF